MCVSTRLMPSEPGANALRLIVASPSILCLRPTRIPRVTILNDSRMSITTTATTATTVAPATDDLGSSLMRHGVAAVLGRMVNLLTAALSSVVLARLLSQEDFGRFSVLLTSISFLALIASFGLGQVALKLIGECASRHGQSEQWRIVRKLIEVGMVSHAIGGLFAALVFYWVVPLAISSDVPISTAILLAFCVIFRGVLMVLCEIARAFDLPLTANLLSGISGGGLLNGLLLGLIALFSVFFISDWRTSVGVMFVATAIVLPLSGWLLKQESKKPKRNSGTPQANDGQIHRAVTAMLPTSWDEMALDRELKSTIVYNGLSMMLVSCIVFAADQADVFLPGLGGDIGEASLYVAARRLTLLLGILPAVVNMAVGGFVAKLYYSQQHVELTRIMRVASAAASIPCAVFCIVAMLFPEWCLQIVFGATYASAANYLQILMPAQFVIVCTGSAGMVLMMTGRERIVLIVQGLIAALLFTVGPWLILVFGVTPFAYLVSALLIAQNAINCWLAYRLNGILTAPGYKDLWLASLRFLESRQRRKS